MPKATNPDAKQIAKCAAWIERERRAVEANRACDALPPGAAKDAKKAERDALRRGYQRRLDAIAATPVMTLAGVAAMGAVVTEHWGETADVTDTVAVALLAALRRLAE